MKNEGLSGFTIIITSFLLGGGLLFALLWLASGILAIGRL